MFTKQSTTAASSPVVTTDLVPFLGVDGVDLLINSSFSGSAPTLSGTVELVLGNNLGPSINGSSSLSALAPIVQASPETDLGLVGDITFAAPASGSNGPLTGSIAITTSVAGADEFIQPLIPLLSATSFGATLAKFAPALNSVLSGLVTNGTITGEAPTGGTLHAQPWVQAELGSGSAGVGITTSNARLLASTAGAAATLANDAATALTDAQKGNLFGALAAGAGALAGGAALLGDLGALATTAGHVGAPTLASIASPVLSLDGTINDSQSISTLLGTLNIGETIGLVVNADQYGAAALGTVLADSAPSLAAALGSTARSTTSSGLTVLANLLSGLGTLATDLSTNLNSNPGGAVQSTVGGPDVAIGITIGLSEQLGPVDLKQSFTVDLATNASGLVDIGNALVPALAPVLGGLAQTQAGQEIGTIVSTILNQTQQKLAAI